MGSLFDPLNREIEFPDPARKFPVLSSALERSAAANYGQSCGFDGSKSPRQGPELTNFPVKSRVSREMQRESGSLKTARTAIYFLPNSLCAAWRAGE